MAKIQDQLVVIKLSKLVKNDDAPVVLADQTVLQNVELVLQELLGEKIIVELEEIGEV